MNTTFRIILGSVSVCMIIAGAGLSYYGRNMYGEDVRSSIQKSYNDGYEAAKLDALKIMNRNYEKIFKALESNADKTSVEYYITTEERLLRIMEKSNPKLTEKEKLQYIKYIFKWSTEYKLSPLFVASIIHRETNFKASSVSKSNARGPMQVLAKWHPEKLKKIKIKETDLHSINHGIHVGCWIIKEYLERSNYDYRSALSKYVGAVNNSADSYIKDIFNMTMYGYLYEL